jgi:hypothetical protein
VVGMVLLLAGGRFTSLGRRFSLRFHVFLTLTNYTP